MVVHMSRNVAVQTILRAIPRQRSRATTFAFTVTPPAADPVSIELFATDIGDATQRVTHLAVQAYGPGTTVAVATA